MTRFYLAGPEVFLLDAVEVLEQKKLMVERYDGFKAITPLDGEAVEEGSVIDAPIIFHSNVEKIRECDVVIANLTPFRGVSADAGTIFEVGYAYGLGKRCIGYTNDPRPYIERVSEEYWPTVTSGERVFASDGMSIENFGLSENLMIDYSCRNSLTHMIFRRKEEANVKRIEDLEIFDNIMFFLSNILR